MLLWGVFFFSVVFFLILTLSYKKLYFRLFYDNVLMLEIELFPFVLVISDFKSKKDKKLRIFSAKRSFIKILASFKAMRYLLSKAKPTNNDYNCNDKNYIFNSSVRLYNFIFAFFLYYFHIIFKRKVV